MMEKALEELFEQVKYLAGDTIYQTDEYQELAVKQVRLYLKMRSLFGDVFGEMMEEYNGFMIEEWEMENKYFFEQGYLIGRKDALS